MRDGNRFTEFTETMDSHDMIDLQAQLRSEKNHRGKWMHYSGNWFRKDHLWVSNRKHWILIKTLKGIFFIRSKTNESRFE